MAGVVALFYRTGWEAPLVNFNIAGQGWTTDHPMVASPLAQFPNQDYKFTTFGACPVTFALQDGHGAWDNHGGCDYTIDAPGIYVLCDGVISLAADTMVPVEGDVKEAISPVLLFVKAAWDTTCIHYCTNTASWTSPPGAMMTRNTTNILGLGDCFFMCVNAASVTFALNNGGDAWNNNFGQDFHINSSGVFMVDETGLKRLDAPQDRKRKSTEDIETALTAEETNPTATTTNTTATTTDITETEATTTTTTTTTTTSTERDCTMLDDQTTTTTATSSAPVTPARPVAKRPNNNESPKLSSPAVKTIPATPTTPTSTVRSMGLSNSSGFMATSPSILSTRINNTSQASTPKSIMVSPSKLAPASATFTQSPMTIVTTAGADTLTPTEPGVIRVSEL